MLRWLLIAAAIFFIFIFAMVWLGIITGLTVAMPVLTNFFPGQELMTVIAMGNVLFAIGLPLLGIILLIVRVVFGRRIGRGWSTAMIVFWFINVFSLVSIGGVLAQEFMVEDQVEELLTTSSFADETVELTYVPWSGEHSASVFVFDEKVELPGATTRFGVRKSTDGAWHLRKVVTARGKRGAAARDLASELPLTLEMTPGRVAMPQEVPFAELSKWRAQEVKLELEVPVGAYVKLNEQVVDFGDIRVDRYPTVPQLYKMTESGALICLDCPLETTDTDRNQLSETLDTNDQAWSQYRDYREVSIVGAMKVTIEQGEAYDFRLTGPQEKVTTTLEDGLLHIELADDAGDAPVRLYLTLPSLQEVSLQNTDDILIKGFTDEALSINAAGEFELKADVTVRELNLAGRAGVELEFTGTAEVLNAHLEEGSRLDTDRGTVQQARISGADGSKIKIGKATELLERTLSEDSNLRIVN